MAQAAKPQTPTQAQTDSSKPPVTPVTAQPAPPRPGSVFTDFASI